MRPEFRYSLAVTRRGQGRSAREGLQVPLSVGQDSLLERLKAAR